MTRTADYSERLTETEGAGRMLDEHLARYRFAASWLRGRRVLDVAAGSGWGASLLSAPERSVIGVEIDATAVALAARRGMVVVRADAQQLPFAGSSFDGCVSSETIEHVADPASFVAELARVLAPGATLVLTTPNGRSEAIRHDNPYHLREFSADELTGVLAPRFEIVRWAGQYPRGAAPRAWIRRSIAYWRIFRPIRSIVPPRYRARFGRAAAGPATVVLFEDPERAAPSTFAIVARRAAV